MTFHNSPGRLHGMVSSMGEESCPDDVDLSTLPSGGDYFGYKTLHYIEHVNAFTTDERWIILELECYAVKAIYTAQGAREVKEISMLKEGEPPAEMKFLPPDYVERSPAAVEKLHAEKNPRGEGFTGNAAITKRWEDDYWRQR